MMIPILSNFLTNRFPALKSFYVSQSGMTPRQGLNRPNTDGSTPMATPLRDKLSINEDDMAAGGLQVKRNILIQDCCIFF